MNRRKIDRIMNECKTSFSQAQERDHRFVLRKHTPKKSMPDNLRSTVDKLKL